MGIQQPREYCLPLHSNPLKSLFWVQTAQTAPRQELFLKNDQAAQELTCHQLKAPTVTAANLFNCGLQSANLYRRFLLPTLFFLSLSGGGTHAAGGKHGFRDPHPSLYESPRRPKGRCQHSTPLLQIPLGTNLSDFCFQTIHFWAPAFKVCLLCQWVPLCQKYADTCVVFRSGDLL
jgi:hypothetical protein